MRITRDIDIEAPTEVAWGLTLDLVGLGGTVLDQRAERLDAGPIRIGSRVRVQQLGLPARVWTVEELVWPSFVRWTTPFAGGLVRATHVVAPGPGGRSRVTLRVDVEGGVAPAVGRLGLGMLRRVLDAEASRLELAGLAASHA